MFRPLIEDLAASGDQVLTSARDKDVTLKLLEAYGLEFVRVGKQGGILGIPGEWIGRFARLLQLARSFRPDLILGESNPVVAQVANLTGARSLVFLDTEHAKLQNRLLFPFADVLCTPRTYPEDLGPGHLRYNGSKELIYLHPRYYTPDTRGLSDFGVETDERYILVRSVSWTAAHDVGHRDHRMSLERIVTRLDKLARVLVSCEGPAPRSLEPYLIKAPPHRMHDVLAMASLYIGDGATMASEAAVLGVPAIFVSPLRLRYIDHLERDCGLVFRLPEEDALTKAEELFSDPGTGKTWKARRNEFLKGSWDVRRCIVELARTVAGNPSSRGHARWGPRRPAGRMDGR